MTDSSIPKFFEKTHEEKLDIICNFSDLNDDELMKSEYSNFVPRRNNATINKNEYNIIEDGPRIVHLEGSVEERLKTIKSTLDKLNIAIKI